MYLSAVSLLSHEHHFPPLRCSAARQGTKGLADIKTAGVLRYSHLQFGNTAEGLHQTATFEGQEVQRKKPEAGTVPDRLQGSSCHTHARQTGERQKTEAPSFRKTPPGSAITL